MKNIANISEILVSEDIALYTGNTYFIQKFGRTKTFEVSQTIVDHRLRKNDGLVTMV
ncbi:hypothetical protein FA15DRAFT_518093 [Coprinopsis marcescibilis]|uniref:Uncharacterized protein n=1 Tax=Coprinopsis marcescibilis TaxID=230819 RepID=A0A5C3KQG7_COPMA|nr:hypothetical protein FA15DRAFT_518093 [Coprinopsis marcescibilis]